jgi:asparagine synthetase B (glutamine-hydrolysing)
MCGLAGAIRVGDRGQDLDLGAIVQRMCDLQAYRGPDDSGVVTLGHVSLGSRRLSIIDLSPEGHMPMSDSTGRWWIAYNGEVYNFAPIREELLARGHIFRSQSDTEVVLHAYMEWGSESLQRFVGMFAFAICDTHSGEVILARDRYGKKPLYYAEIGGVVMFASEMKALMVGRRDLRIDQQALVEWFLYRNVDRFDAAHARRGYLGSDAGPGGPYRTRRHREIALLLPDLACFAERVRAVRAGLASAGRGRGRRAAERCRASAAHQRRARGHASQRRPGLQFGHRDRGQADP